jgi:hypothetical protein
VLPVNWFGHQNVFFGTLSPIGKTLASHNEWHTISTTLLLVLFGHSIMALLTIEKFISPLIRNFCNFFVVYFAACDVAGILILSNFGVNSYFVILFVEVRLQFV